jgi:adenylate cyclase, class 2
VTRPDRTETEVKLRVPDADAARGALLGIGARLARERHFEDNLLLDDGERGLAGAGSVLRIRRASGEGVLTFKGPRRIQEGVKSREEIELSVGDPDALQEVLERLGLRPVFRYQKYRETYRLGGLEIVVDETPIGAFLELEGPMEEIHAAAQRLGFGREDYVAESYAGLFHASGASGDMVFPETA